jgi:hypothetical protein
MEDGRMIKRFAWAGLLALALLVPAVEAFAETRADIPVIMNRVKLNVNGRRAGAPTMLYDGYTYIQLRGAAEAFGAALEWDGAANAAYLTTARDAPAPAEAAALPDESAAIISVILDRVKLIVNGGATGAKTMLYGGYTYIQLRGAADAFGAALEWDGGTNTAHLSVSANPPAPSPSPSPPAAKPENKVFTVYYTPRGEKFHRENCRTLARSGTVVSCSREQAEMMGLAPCKVCEP